MWPQAGHYQLHWSNVLFYKLRAKTEPESYACWTFRCKTLYDTLRRMPGIMPAYSMFSQFSSVAKSCPTLCDPMDCSTPGLPGIWLHHLLEFAQTQVHWVGDAIQPSYLLSSPSPAFNLSQYQGLFHWVGSSHQVAKVLKLQLQHQPFQWIFNVRLYL